MIENGHCKFIVLTGYCDWKQVFENVHGKVPTSRNGFKESRTMDCWRSHGNGDGNEPQEQTHTRRETYAWKQYTLSFVLYITTYNKRHGR